MLSHGDASAQGLSYKPLKETNKGALSIEKQTQSMRKRYHSR
jgi:hypothetical protein